MNWTEIIDLAMQFRSAIDEVKYGISPHDRMRGFPRGCCDDATDLFAYHLYQRFGITTTRVDGSYYADNPKDNDWHTWLEIEGKVVDLTADQFPDYNDVYLGAYDQFHKRYKQERIDYRGFIDLGVGCQQRMKELYNLIEQYIQKHHSGASIRR